MSRPRATIRVRLAVLYAATTFLLGAALIALTYVYLGQALDHELTARGDIGELIRDSSGTGDVHDRKDAPALHAAIQAQFERSQRDTLRAMLVWSLSSLSVVALVAAAAGWALAGRTLRPLRRIAGTARRVADRNLHERIALAGPSDEIKDLADTFDAMLERLDRSFDGQRRFVANASHELRTPLTINRTLIEVALDADEVPEPMTRLGTTLLDVNRRHERLIDSLLVLASSEQELTDLDTVDLTAAARRAADLADTAARAQRILITVAAEAAPVRGDPVLLDRLAQNLVENAVRYNTSDGFVSITVRAGDGQATLTVENGGPAVPANEAEGLFEPFRRLGGVERVADAEDRGSGLGLSIARAIAEAHRGCIRATARPGGGLTVTLLIPTAEPVRAPA